MRKFVDVRVGDAVWRYCVWGHEVRLYDSGGSLVLCVPDHELFGVSVDVLRSVRHMQRSGSMPGRFKVTPAVVLDYMLSSARKAVEAV